MAEKPPVRVRDAILILAAAAIRDGDEEAAKWYGKIADQIIRQRREAGRPKRRRKVKARLAATGTAIELYADTIEELGDGINSI